jgi:hypothetical protein
MAIDSPNLHGLLARGFPDPRKDPDMRRDFERADAEARQRYPLEMDGRDPPVEFIWRRMQEFSDARQKANAPAPREPQPVRSSTGSYFWRPEDLVYDESGVGHDPRSVDAAKIRERRAQRTQQVKPAEASTPSNWGGLRSDQRFFDPKDMVTDPRTGQTFAPNSIDAQRVREQQAADERYRQYQREQDAQRRLNRGSRPVTASDRNAVLPVPRKGGV